MPAFSQVTRTVTPPAARFSSRATRATSQATASRPRVRATPTHTRNACHLSHNLTSACLGLAARSPASPCITCPHPHTTLGSCVCAATRCKACGGNENNGEICPVSNKMHFSRGEQHLSPGPPPALAPPSPASLRAHPPRPASHAHALHPHTHTHMPRGMPPLG